MCFLFCLCCFVAKGELRTETPVCRRIAPEYTRCQPANGSNDTAGAHARPGGWALPAHLSSLVCRSIGPFGLKQSAISGSLRVGTVGEYPSSRGQVTRDGGRVKHQMSMWPEHSALA